MLEGSIRAWQNKHWSMHFYDDHADAYAERTSTVDMSDVYRRFLPHLSSGARILDVGCGPGRDLKFFRDQGFRVQGIDSSREMVKRALGVGVPVHHKSCLAITEENAFEGVWASASLLHLTQVDFVQALARLFKALCSQGAFYFSVKAGDGVQTDAEGRFFTYYQVDDLKQILAQFSEVAIQEIWLSGDSMGRSQVQWINVICRKK